MNRSGMLQDIIYFVAFMFMLAFFTLGMYIAWSETNDAFADSESITPEAKALFDNQADRFPSWMDYTYLTIMVAVFIGILILSYFVSSVPIMFWAMWLFIMVLSAIAGYLANAWFETTTTDGVLSIAVQQFPIMNYIVTNYMVVVIVLGMLMLIVFFAKPAGGTV